MRPNDDNGKLTTAERPFRVLIISGPDRRQYKCPGIDSKSRALMFRMAERLPQDWEIDYKDPGVEVPDNLWRYVEFGRGKKYSDNAGSSPAKQEELGLDEDLTLTPEKSEGEKLRR